MKFNKKIYIVYSLLAVVMIVCLACLETVDIMTSDLTTDPNEETTVTQPDPLPAGQGLAAGTTAPAFSLPDAGENTVSLSDYAGEIVVIQFFSTST